MKNIETVELYKIEVDNLQELQKCYNAPIPNHFEDIVNKVNGTFAFHITPVSTIGFDNAVYIHINDIANKLQINDIEDAYKRYVPYVIRYRMRNVLPYQEAISCNEDGEIKIVHYKRYTAHINRLLSYYCYELKSEEQFEDRNNEQTAILKYKLVIKEC